MQQLEEQIKGLKTKIEDAKNKRYRAEIRLEELEKKEKEILNQLAELGVEPNSLDEEIEKLEKEIQKEIEEVKQMIPQELL
jgi:chromosome segregation ATPase